MRPLPAAPGHPHPNREQGRLPPQHPRRGGSAPRQGSQSPVPTQTLCTHQGGGKQNWSVLHGWTLLARCPGSLWAPGASGPCSIRVWWPLLLTTTPRSLAKAGEKHSLPRSQERRLQPSRSQVHGPPSSLRTHAATAQLSPPLTSHVGPLPGPSVQPHEVGEGPRTPPCNGSAPCPRHRLLPTSIPKAALEDTHHPILRMRKPRLRPCNPPSQDSQPAQGGHFLCTFSFKQPLEGN